MLSSGMDTLVPQSTDAFDHAAHSGVEHKSSAGEFLYLIPNLLRKKKKTLKSLAPLHASLCNPLEPGGNCGNRGGLLAAAPVDKTSKLPCACQ